MNKKKMVLLLIFSLVLTIIPIQESAWGKSKNTSTRYNVSLVVGQSVSCSSSNVKASNIKTLVLKINKKNIVNVKKQNNRLFYITGKRVGNAKVTAILTLKKSVRGKKRFVFIYKVKVKSSSVGPTPTSTNQPNPQQSFDEVEAKISLLVERYKQVDDYIIYKITNNYSLPLAYNINMLLYHGELLMDSNSVESYSFDHSEYPLIINPSDTQYVRGSITDLDKYLLREEIEVRPILGEYSFRPAKTSEYKIKYGIVGGEYVFNAECLIKKHDIYYECFVLGYKDGVLKSIEPVSGYAGFGETSVERVQLEDNKEYTFEVIPARVLVCVDSNEDNERDFDPTPPENPEWTP